MITPQASCTDINEPGLISFKAAKESILDAIKSLEENQKMAIEKAKSRCLAEDIISPINVPIYTNSAVDGYALHADDLPKAKQNITLIIQATVLAGEIYTEACQAKHCIRIMTGAAMPEGLDTVIMQEHCERSGNNISIDDRHTAGQNVRQAGEDITKGCVVLQKGKFLCPADIGLLASFGISEIFVKRPLRVAIASTGNEVSPISIPLKEGNIYDSNRYSLLAALDRSDIEIVDLGIIKDDTDNLLKTFNDAADYADVIISSGGVSVGEADFTKAALQSDGKINFWKVAIKPGRPIAFGKIKDCDFFGLPGNPVAVLVTFYQFVLPALEKKLGIIDKPIAPIMKAISLENIRKRAGRTEIQRGIVSQSESGEWQVKTTGKQGSGILSSMSLANAFIILSDDQASVKKGDQVDVQLFSHLF